MPGLLLHQRASSQNNKAILQGNMAKRDFSFSNKGAKSEFFKLSVAKPLKEHHTNRDAQESEEQIRKEADE